MGKGATEGARRWVEGGDRERESERRKGEGMEGGREMMMGVGCMS